MRRPNIPEYFSAFRTHSRSQSPCCGHFHIFKASALPSLVTSHYSGGAHVSASLCGARCYYYYYRRHHNCFHRRHHHRQPSRRQRQVATATGASTAAAVQLHRHGKRHLFLCRSRKNMSSAILSGTVCARDTAGIVDTLGTTGVFHPTPFGIVVDILDALDHTSTCHQHSAPGFRRVPETPLNCSSLP